MLNMLRDVNESANQLRDTEQYLEQGFTLLAEANKIPFATLVEAASHYVAGAKQIMQNGAGKIDNVGKISPILAALDGYSTRDDLRGVVQKFATSQGQNADSHIMKLIANPSNPEEKQAHDALYRIGSSEQFQELKNKWDGLLTQASFAQDPQAKQEAARQGLAQLAMLDKAVRAQMQRVGQGQQQDKQFDWHKQSQATQTNPRAQG